MVTLTATLMGAIVTLMGAIVTLMGAIVTIPINFIVSTTRHLANQLLFQLISRNVSLAPHDPIPDLSVAVSGCEVRVLSVTT